MATTGNIISLVLMLVVIGVTIPLTSQIVSDIQDTESDTTSYLYNTSDNTLSAFDTISNFMSPLGLIVIVVVLMTVLMMFRSLAK